MGYGYELFTFTLAPGEVSHAPEVARVEVVCREEQVDVLIDAILETYKGRAIRRGIQAKSTARGGGTA
jgi:hypothetical protein